MIRYGYVFLLDKKQGNHEANLRFRVHWHGMMTSFSIGYKVEVKKWSSDANRCKNNTFHTKKQVTATVINAEMGRYEKMADEAFSIFEKQNHIPTTDEFRKAFNALNGKGSMEQDISLFSLFDEFVSKCSTIDNWSDATLKKFRTIRNNLHDFNPKLTVSDISNSTLESLLKWYVRRGYHNSTIDKIFAIIRWFIRWLYKNDYYQGKVHETFKPKMKNYQREVIYLSWSELMTLYDIELPNKKLESVRDAFCLCCFTSLRYSDLAKLSKNDVKDTCISVVTQKTTDSLKIELNKYSKAILDKYKDIPIKDDKALFVYSNQKMNDYLKEIGQLAGLNEKIRIVYYIGNERHENVFEKWELITTHCGRRTFIVNALFLGIPSEVVMKWTGHSDFKAMKPYVKIVDELKIQEMEKFNK